MKNAGGVLTILGGFFGVLAAMITGIFGGIGQGLWNWFMVAGGAAHAVESTQMVDAMAQNGMLFSGACIVLGFAAFFVKSPWMGGAILLVALVGMGQGGSLVAFSLVLAALGGALVIFGALNKEPSPDQNRDQRSLTSNRRVYRPPPKDE